MGAAHLNGKQTAAEGNKAGHARAHALSRAAKTKRPGPTAAERRAPNRLSHRHRSTPPPPARHEPSPTPTPTANRRRQRRRQRAEALPTEKRVAGGAGGADAAGGSRASEASAV